MKNTITKIGNLDGSQPQDEKNKPAIDVELKVEFIAAGGESYCFITARIKGHDPVRDGFCLDKPSYRKEFVERLAQRTGYSIEQLAHVDQQILDAAADDKKAAEASRYRYARKPRITRSLRRG